MERVFVTKNNEGYEVGSFFISVTSREGVRYEYIRGEEPDWHDVVWAITYIMSTMDMTIPENENIFGREYKILPDNTFDIRFIPVLVSNKSTKVEKLPLTVDGISIFEHSFRIPFYTAVKVMLALSMAYENRKLVVRRRKLVKIMKGKLTENSVEVLNGR